MSRMTYAGCGRENIMVTLAQSRIVIAIIFAIALFSWSVVHAEPIERSDLVDFNAKLKLILDGVMPMKHGDGRLPEGVTWRLTIRILPPFDHQDEWYALVHLFHDGRYSISLIQPIDKPIQAQIKELLQPNENISSDKLEKLLRLNRIMLSDADIPVLRDLFERLHRVRMSPLAQPELIMDAFGYRFISESLFSTVDLIVPGVGFQGREDEHPVVQWIDELRVTIDSFQKGKVYGQ